MREKVMHLAADGQISWLAAADMMGISPRQMYRVRALWQRHGLSALMDQRGRVPRRKRIKPQTVKALCELRRAGYRDFSVKHFYEHADIETRYGVSYSYVLRMLQDVGLADKAEGKGRYYRKRQRKPMTGMMVHLDASRHRWLGANEPMWDLLVALDDADGRMLYAKFVPEEDSLSCIAAIEHILRRHGRFTSLYTDRGSHFCTTSHKGQKPNPEQHTHIARICEALGIRHIRAMSPQARGRSERAFGTIQGRLPQELKLHGITDYESANRYLTEVFVPDFNRRFCHEPDLAESAFVPLGQEQDLSLLMSVQHQRKVQNDHTVSFENLKLQIPPQGHRFGFAKCKVTVHQFPDATFGISHLGVLLAKYTLKGELLTDKNINHFKAA